MITTKGTIDIAWLSTQGQANARFAIPNAVSEIEGKPGFCRVRPTALISCTFTEIDHPRITAIGDDIPEYLVANIRHMLSLEFIVHRSTVQHGAMHYHRQGDESDFGQHCPQ